MRFPSGVFPSRSQGEIGDGPGPTSRGLAALGLDVFVVDWALADDVADEEPDNAADDTDNGEQSVEDGHPSPAAPRQ